MKAKISSDHNIKQIIHSRQLLKNYKFFKRSKGKKKSLFGGFRKYLVKNSLISILQIWQNYVSYARIQHSIAIPN